MPNYDNDPQMKEVMDNFNKQTQQRFHEYNDLMIEKRQKCKEQCDKVSQKIILKDKLEKQMEQQLTTLETKIDTDDIPTCICEKSLADKVEKGCLKCGYGLGTVAASIGLFGGLGTYGWEIAATSTAIAATKVAAEQAGIEAGHLAGAKAVIDGLFEKLRLEKLFDIPLIHAITKDNYFDVARISKGVKQHYLSLFAEESTCENNYVCSYYKDLGVTEGTQSVVENTEKIVRDAVNIASEETFKFTKSKIAELQADELGKVSATSCNSYSAIGYSILAILIIVLIMVIIYLILRYRRKKKMKKKLQYIKLLEE
ncbi:rifin [Plasmodium falciparum RAJ116]|uniref:Rifin n=1 Tax=Plasmodium falciparum RAJ116 TaxID=580058 RepID=A0A0L0CYY1_PLAFA|nr:rifin [Plasmodium falciparum RAJ116]